MSRDLQITPTPSEPDQTTQSDEVSRIPTFPSGQELFGRTPLDEKLVLPGVNPLPSNEFLTRVMPHRVGFLEREWRGMKAQWDSNSNYVLGIMKLSREYALSGNQTEIGANVIAAVAEPILGPIHAVLQIDAVHDFLNIPPNTPVDPEELEKSKKERPRITYPKHMNKFLFNILNQEWDEKQVNLAVLANQEKPGLIASIVGFGTEIAMSVLTNPIGAVVAGTLPVVLDAGLVGLEATAWGERLGFGLSEKAAISLTRAQRVLANTSGKATKFLLENAVTTAAWSAPQIGLEFLMGQTNQALLDIHNLGDTFTNFAFITGGFKLAGVALNKAEIKAFDYLKRRHQTMSPEAAADMKEAAVNQTSRGHDAQQDIQMRKALNDQAARMQGEMDAEGISVDDANSVLNKGDEEIKADLEAKTKIQDEAEKPFRAAAFGPANAERLSNRLDEIDNELGNIKLKDVTKSIASVKENIAKLTKTVGKLTSQRDALSEKLKSEKKDPEKNKEFNKLKAEIESQQKQQTQQKDELQKLNDNADLFQQREDIIKRTDKLVKKIAGDKKVKDPVQTLKAAVSDWRTKDDSRFEAKQNLNANELLRHFVNSKERFSKSDLDKFVLQQGPAREEFAAERGEPTPFVPGRDIENPSTLLEDRFTDDDIQKIFDEANMDETQQEDWDELQKADKNRDTLRSALKAAGDCLRNRET